jgi:hypothetical protein
MPRHILRLSEMMSTIATHSAPLLWPLTCYRSAVRSSSWGREVPPRRSNGCGSATRRAPQRLRLLFLVNRSTQHARDSNRDDLSCFKCWVSNVICIALPSHMKRSQRTSVVQKTHVDQKTACAVLLRSVARFSSLFPLPTFSVVENESSTN